MTFIARKHARRAAFSAGTPCVMPYRNEPANMSPAPVRSFGSQANAGTMRLDAVVADVGAVRAVGHDRRGHHAFQLARTPPRRRRPWPSRHGFGLIAEQQVRLLEGFVKGVAEDVRR